MGSYNYNVNFYSVILAILMLLPFYDFYFYVFIFMCVHLSHCEQWRSTKCCRKKKEQTDTEIELDLAEEGNNVIRGRKFQLMGFSLNC